jgi:type I restriction enzyme S subunit
MKDSGIEWIGEIPEDWRIPKLKYFATLRSGITLGKTYSQNEKLHEYFYLRVANVQSGYVDLSDLATIFVPNDEAQKYFLHDGEILMTEGGDRDKLGRGCIWHSEIPVCLHQNHIFALQTKKELVAKYFDYITTSGVARNYFDYTAKKTTNLASTNSTTILDFIIPLPSISEQQFIVAYLDQKCSAIDKTIAEGQALTQRLVEYKKSLIYEAVTGKMEINSK